MIEGSTTIFFNVRINGVKCYDEYLVIIIQTPVGISKSQITSTCGSVNPSMNHHDQHWTAAAPAGHQLISSWLEADSADSFARECDFLPVLGNNQIYCRDGPSNKTEFSLWKTEVDCLLIITCSSNFTKILMLCNLKKVRNRKYFVIVDPKTEMANKINGNTIFLIRSNWVYQNLNAFIQIFDFYLEFLRFCKTIKHKLNKEKIQAMLIKIPT
jgi:hypothetical protein